MGVGAPSPLDPPPAHLDWCYEKYLSFENFFISKFLLKADFWKSADHLILILTI